MSVIHLPLQKLLQEIGTSLDGLDAAQTQLRPAGGSTRWSIQQVTEHLLLTYASTCGVLETRIAKGRPTLARPTLLERIRQCAVCRFEYFPEGRKAPAAVTPPDARPASGDMLADQARDVLTRLDNLVLEVERLFGRGRSTTHHVLGPLSPHQWLRFHLVHGRHHLRQIRSIRAVHSV
jgi:hypothetical protein